MHEVQQSLKRRLIADYLINHEDALDMPTSELLEPIRDFPALFLTPTDELTILIDGVKQLIREAQSGK